MPFVWVEPEVDFPTGGLPHRMDLGWPNEIFEPAKSRVMSAAYALCFD